MRERNHEIKISGPLLGDDGRPVQAGYSKRPVLTYNRENIRASRLRVKEWNYLLFTSPDYALAFTISDLGYARMGSATVIDFRTGEETTRTKLLPGRHAFDLPIQPGRGMASFYSKDFYISDEAEDGKRVLRCLIRDFKDGEDLQAYLRITKSPDESVNLVIPWGHSPQFYFNQKVNAMRAEGIFLFKGKRHLLSRKNTLATLDWGRGVWPYKTHWFWGTGNDFVNGKPVGLNLGYGFGNTEAASENAVIYEGKVHKLDDVEFLLPPDGRMKPWIITSSDGRAEGLFTPEIDRAAKFNFGLIKSDQHQLFGTFTGQMVLDDGTVLNLEDFRLSVEDIRHKW